MSLPRSLSKDFFSTLADTITNANEDFFRGVHDCPSPVKLLCLQQSCLAENKYLIEVLDGSIPVEYKHSCLAFFHPTSEEDRQLIGKVISFSQYKISPTKFRYLVVLTRITVCSGDYRHLIGHLLPSLVYNPRLSVNQESNGSTPKRDVSPKHNTGPMRKPESTRNVKTIANPYNSPKSPKRMAAVPTKISDLTLYTPKWSIRARVVSKSDIHKFNNQRGESQLFSVDLCDTNGEIRAVFFGESVNKWYAFIEEGQVYSISGGQLKPANKKFNSLKHSCELILDENSQIQLFRNDETIPPFCLSFTPLDQIGTLPMGDLVDVMGIVVMAEDTQTVITKSTGTSMERREFMLCDSTGATMWVTVWGSKISLVNYKGPDSQPLVCIKGAKVGEWNNKRVLQALSSCQIICEPVIPDAIKLRKWWNEYGQSMTFQKETSKRTKTQAMQELCTISHIISATSQALQFKSIDSNGMVFTTRALIEQLKNNNFSWPSCTGCRKGMKREDGVWICHHCNNQSNPIHKYMLTMRIIDDSSHLWITAMAEVGETIMGTKAHDLVTLMESEGEDKHGKNYENYFEDARLSEFVFKIKATVENFMEEPRIKYRVLKAMPLMNEIQMVIDDRVENIKKLMGQGPV